jgi:hypothetical protein
VSGGAETFLEEGASEALYKEPPGVVHDMDEPVLQKDEVNNALSDDAPVFLPRGGCAGTSGCGPCP